MQVEGAQLLTTASLIGLTERREIIRRIKIIYGRQCNKTLCGTDSAPSNDRCFSLSCKDCGMLIIVGKKRRGGDEVFEITEHCQVVNWQHISKSGDNICNGGYKPSQKEVKAHPMFNILKNSQSKQLGKKTTTMPLKGMKLALSNCGLQNVSQSIIKAASAKFRLSALEHIQSYNLLDAYLAEMMDKNPTMRYHIHAPIGLFIRMMVVFPDSAKALPNLMNVVGLDTAFMDLVSVQVSRANIIIIISVLKTETDD
jgi:hypothetical protein